MPFRDDLEAAQQRARSLDAQLEAERGRREQAEAGQRAAEAKLAEVQAAAADPGAREDPERAQQRIRERRLPTLIAVGFFVAVIVGVAWCGWRDQRRRVAAEGSGGAARYSCPTAKTS